MNLEELISKYLDGELSFEEDIELRRLISEDDYSREKFYSSVSVHLALREDAASIETPDDVFRETEDKVMMRILQDAPPEAEPKRKRRFIPALLPIAAAFLLFLAVPFGDMERILLSPSLLVESKLEQPESNDKTVPESAAEELAYEETQSAEPATDLVSDDRDIAASDDSPREDNPRAVPAFTATGPAGNTAVSDLAINETAAQLQDFPIPVNLVSDDISLGSGNESGLINTGVKTSDVNALQAVVSIPRDGLALGKPDPALRKSRIPENILNTRNTLPDSEVMQIDPFNNPYENDEITVASFFGTDFYRGGMESKDSRILSHFSQSVAYSMNDDERMGIELGFTEYSYTENTIRQFALPQNESGGGGMVEVLDPSSYDGSENGYITVPIEVDRNKQIFWGAAFYERTVFDSFGLSLQGRLGFGSSEDGILGYGRLFAKYELFSGLYVTLGSEGRFFTAKMYDLSQMDKKLRSTASVIYGLQFKF